MRTRATILSTANDPNSVSLLFEEHFHSSTSRSDSEHRRYQRTAQRISSGAVCRHLNIAGRVAFFTIFSDYQPPSPKLQPIQPTRSFFDLMIGMHTHRINLFCGHEETSTSQCAECVDQTPSSDDAVPRSFEMESGRQGAHE